MMNNSGGFTMKQLQAISVFFRDLSHVQIGIFTMKNRKHQTYVDVFRKYFQEYNPNIRADMDEAVRYYLSRMNQWNPNDSNPSIPMDDDVDDDHLIRMIEIHVFYRLFMMRLLKEDENDDPSKKQSQTGEVSPLDHYARLSERPFWFRGQTNRAWLPIPSMFRSPRMTKLWTWDDVLADYATKPKHSSLTRKLGELDIDAKKEPYRTLAFIQHSIAYSPLVDFTRSPFVALSFALANGASLVDFYGNDACFDFLDISDLGFLTTISQIDNAIRNFKVQTFRKNVGIWTLIRNRMWVDLLMGNVSSRIHLIDFPTNDRMLYQKGTFLLFDHAVIIGDELYLSIGKMLSLSKRLHRHPILVAEKDDTYKALMEQSPQYNSMYLLNPYYYMGELNK